MPATSIDKALGQLDQIIADVRGAGSSNRADTRASPMSSSETPLSVEGLRPGTATEPAIVGPGVPEGGVQDKSHVPPVQNVHPSGAPARQKAKKGGAPPPAGSGDEKVDNFNKALLQVGRVASVEDHPVAEKLLVCKVEVAPGEFKQVVAGLRKHIAKEELLLRLVCLILNLKPAKLAGTPSEAMILAGDGPLAEGSSPEDDNRVVKVLEPPGGASIGDRIFLEGLEPSENTPKQLSSKVWEKIVPLLQVRDGHAAYDGKLLTTKTGSIRVPGLPGGSGIH